jgi:hypothetical protein
VSESESEITGSGAQDRLVLSFKGYVLCELL